MWRFWSSPCNPSGWRVILQLTSWEGRQKLNVCHVQQKETDTVLVQKQAKVIHEAGSQDGSRLTEEEPRRDRALGTAVLLVPALNPQAC